MLGFTKKYKIEDIKSAHEKQRNFARGQGGVKFTEIEREILDNHIFSIPEVSEDDDS